MSAPKPHIPNTAAPTRTELIEAISELVKARAPLLIFDYPCEQQEVFQEQFDAAEQLLIELIERIPNLTK